MHHTRLVEFIFFFGALSLVGYIVWQIFAPFITALSLAAVIVVVCYPVYDFFLKYLAKRNRTIAALVTTFVVFLVIVTPVFLLSTLLVNEFLSFYHTLDSGVPLPIESQFSVIQDKIKEYIPGFNVNISEQLRESILWFTP